MNLYEQTLADALERQAACLRALAADRPKLERLESLADELSRTLSAGVAADAIASPGSTCLYLQPGPKNSPTLADLCCALEAAGFSIEERSGCYHYAALNDLRIGLGEASKWAHPVQAAA